MPICGKPAAYFGTLALDNAESISESYSYQRSSPVVAAPFCEECTLTPNKRWHRQFISFRRAIPYERCQVPK